MTLYKTRAMKIKQLYILLLVLLASNITRSQVPEKFSCQLSVRDANGMLVVNQQVGVRLSILQETVDGDVVYSQTLLPTTNDFGTVALEIGGDDDFSSIDWSANKYFLKTEIDPAGGSSYSISGTTQFVSVPFALHANVTDSINETDPQFTSWNKSAGISITEDQVSDFQDYIDEETDPVFGGWDKSSGIEITENQVSNLQDYLTEEVDPIYSESFNISEPQDGDLLRYNSTSGKWEKFSPNYSEEIHDHINATASQSGFMSADDKIKLDEIEDNAEVNVAYDWNASSGDAAILNKPFKIGHLNTDARNKEITNVGDPELSNDLATKAYVADLENQINKLMQHAGLMVADNEGNYYRVVTIGNQVWMAKNLRVRHYNNGDPIPTSPWVNATSGAYGIYPNFAVGGIDSNEEMLRDYGAAYNWFAVVDPRGICPVGWRVPTDDDWTELTTYVASINDVNVGNQLKYRRQVDSPLGGEWASGKHPRWNSDDTHYGTDDFGFAAVPGGVCEYNGGWTLLGYHASFWTATEYSSTDAWYRNMRQFTGNVSRSHIKKQYGYSVRCIKE